MSGDVSSVGGGGRKRKRGSSAKKRDEGPPLVVQGGKMVPETIWMPLTVMVPTGNNGEQEEIKIEVVAPNIFPASETSDPLTISKDPQPGGSLPPPPQVRKLQRTIHPVSMKKEDLQLQCQWESCDEVETYMDYFVQHMEEHVYCLLNQERSALDEISEMPYICLWDKCDFQSSCAEETQRHIYYHAYHTKVKCLGANMLKRLGLKQGCLYKADTCNILPDLPDSLICAWTGCHMTFLSAHHFYMHVEGHVECNPRGNKVSGGVPCMWEKCQASFPSLHKLRDHVRSHTQEKVVGCPTCGGLFANRTKFFDHCKRQDPVTLQGFQCSHCSKTFALERLLRDHMRQHINHYKCPYCDMTCPQPSGLTTHIKYRHSEIKPFPCSLCDYRAKAQSDLTRHMRTHLATKEYCCSIAGCSFSCRGSQTLNQHLLKVHQTESPRYCCHMCNQVFSRGSYLTHHLIRHHKYRWPSGHSRFRYKCDDDGYLRLQTVRYESLELTEKLMEEENDDFQKSKSVEMSSEQEGASSLQAEERDDESDAPSVVVSFEEVDELGRVISSETVPATHFYIDESKDQEQIKKMKSVWREGASDVPLWRNNGNSRQR